MSLLGDKGKGLLMLMLMSMFRIAVSALRTCGWLYHIPGERTNLAVAFGCDFILF